MRKKSYLLGVLGVVAGSFVFGKVVAAVFGLDGPNTSLPWVNTGPSVSVSPRGDFLCFAATGEGEQDLYLYHVRSKKVTRLTKTAARESDPCFSPDGKGIIYAAGWPGQRGNHLFVRHLKQPSHATPITEGDYNDYQPSFSPDGSKIVFVRDQHYNSGALQSPPWSQPDIYAAQADGSRVHAVTANAELGVNNPQFLADNKTVICASGWGSETWKLCLTIDKSEGVHALRALNPRVSAFELALSPDRKMLVTANDGKMGLLSVKGKNLSSLYTVGLAGSSPVFSHDSKSLFFLTSDPKSQGYDPDHFGLWQVDATGRNAHHIRSDDVFDDPLPSDD